MKIFQSFQDCRVIGVFRIRYIRRSGYMKGWRLKKRNQVIQYAFVLALITFIYFFGNSTFDSRVKYHFSTEDCDIQLFALKKFLLFLLLQLLVLVEFTWWDSFLEFFFYLLFFYKLLWKSLCLNQTFTGTSIVLFGPLFCGFDLVLRKTICIVFIATGTFELIKTGKLCQNTGQQRMVQVYFVLSGL